MYQSVSPATAAATVTPLLLLPLLLFNITAAIEVIPNGDVTTTIILLHLLCSNAISTATQCYSGF